MLADDGRGDRVVDDHLHLRLGAAGDEQRRREHGDAERILHCDVPP